MSIAASEGEQSSSGDDDSAALPPSGVVALPESDPEMAAMLARAAASVGLTWNPPPCPEPSRLDDWYLGAGRAGSQRAAPVPFFPEVHDEIVDVDSLLLPHHFRWRGSEGIRGHPPSGTVCGDAVVFQDRVHLAG